VERQEVPSVARAFCVNIHVKRFDNILKREYVCEFGGIGKKEELN
jgi:hypothetical protein